MAAQLSPTPIAEEEKGGFLDDVKTFVEDNTLPAVLIGVALLLFLVLIVLLIAWGRRRKAAQPEPIGLGGNDWQVAPPYAAPPTEVDAGPAWPAKSPVVPAGGATSAPTVGPGQAGYAPLPGPFAGPPGAGGGPDVPAAGSTRSIHACRNMRRC